MNLPKLFSVFVVATGLLWMVNACSIKKTAVGDTPEQTYESTLVDNNQLQENSYGAASYPTPPQYLVRFGDRLQISFNYAPEFDRQATVRPDGRITLPWVGDLAVVGRTTDVIAEEIEQVYGSIVRNPELIVSVTNIAPMRFYVFGEVLNPGFFDVPNHVTLLEAIAMAGGVTGKAEWKSILLFHPSYLDSGSVEQIDLASTIRTDHYSIHMVQSFDIIYVPPSFISNVHKFISDYFINIVPPVDTYIRNRYYWRLGRQE